MKNSGNKKINVRFSPGLPLFFLSIDALLHKMDVKLLPLVSATSTRLLQEADRRKKIDPTSFWQSNGHSMAVDM